MEAQGSHILLHSVASSYEEDFLIQQLADIGYTQVVTLKDRTHREKLADELSVSAIVVLLTEVSHDQREILDTLQSAGNLPVIGLLSQSGARRGQRIADACDEVATWPCSKQELDYRLGKHTRRCQEKQESGDRCFLRMNILGNSPEFLQVLDKVYKIMKCDAPVFIDGETGTGKELIARAIHYLGKRKDRPFIAENCGALPDQLLENEFFGHARGAYTDAQESSEGIIAQAEGGTLFLDEIEALSSKGQVALLRFLENFTYRPLGGKSTKVANIRVISATNENIPQLVERGCFRKDLYYRINIMNVMLPPLRERSGDINLFADHFIRQYQIRYNQPEKELHPCTRDALKYYDWPGNVRELENVLHREFLLADGKYITISRIESTAGERRSPRGDRRLERMFKQPLVKAKSHLINEFERQYLAFTLSRAKGNVSEAARLAGKERRSFTRLLGKYHLDGAHHKSHPDAR